MTETAWQTARREAYEEIGLPLEDKKLPPGFRIEHLCQLPMNLARTELGVRPTVAFLSANPKTSAAPSGAALNADPSSATASAAAAGAVDPSATEKPPSVEETLIPHLDAKEVAAVFSAPFHNFLRATDESRRHVHTTSSASAPGGAGVEATGFPADWYKGTWTDWHESRWRMHNFYVPVAGQDIARPKSHGRGSSSNLPYSDARAYEEREDPLGKMSRFRVFGMTARILVDAARVAYDELPEFEHNSHFGDEDMIDRLMRMGRLGPIRKDGGEITKADMIAASKL